MQILKAVQPNSVVMKNIYCLLLFVLITFSTFGQQDAWYHYTVAYTSSAFPDYTVYDIDIDQEDNVWFATNTAVSIYDGFTFNNRWDANTWSNNWVVFSASDGSVWTGTFQGVFQVTDNVWTHFTTSNGLANNDVWDIEEDQSGNIWIGTSGGLTKYDGNSMVSYTMEDGLNHNQIRTGWYTLDRHVWRWYLHMGWWFVYTNLF